MPLNLNETDISAWRALEAAASDPASGFRFLNLCSVDADAKPQARMVVLRRTDTTQRTLEFHTDIRSPKWQEIANNPAVTALGYCQQSRLQLRMQGTVSQFDAGSSLHAAAWNLLSSRTQSTYAGGPPGEELSPGDGANSSGSYDSHGRAYFGVILLRVTELDWYQLQREGNQRALLNYNAAGLLVNGKWINP